MAAPETRAGMEAPPEAGPENLRRGETPPGAGEPGPPAPAYNMRKHIINMLENQRITKEYLLWLIRVQKSNQCSQ